MLFVSVWLGVGFAKGIVGVYLSYLQPLSGFKMGILIVG
ncbi:putative membrane protein [Anaplasma phagocytophilum str. ApNP]|uniref:Putative membrane protein n=1 Tax=Anaplasma phagocytophilum str. ApNP TaxID=1359153 RepID=A0A0F3NGV1_ANAPH|nr:putative membrane protein [Anaplasma phagocytophilum str. ApNP]